jgi:hypothetical protein
LTFDDPASFVTPEFPAVLVQPVFAVLALRNNVVDAAVAESLSQWIGDVGSVGDYAFGF